MGSSMYGESGYKRHERDAYFTPDWVIGTFLRAVRLRGEIWEPADGKGAISKAVAAKGYRVHRSDIFDYKLGVPVVDFLAASEAPEGVRTIITNPPYGKAAQAFIEHALELMRPRKGMVAMLLRTEYDHAVTRRHLFEANFAAKLALTSRPVWIAGTDSGGPRHNFAWFVWDFRHHGAAAIRWLHRPKLATAKLAA